MPIGYNTIARVFNNERPNPYRLSTLGPDGRCPSSNHPEPPPSIFFGTNEPEAAQPATDPRVSEMGELLFERELRRNRKMKEERQNKGKEKARDVPGDQEYGDSAGYRGGRVRKRRNRHGRNYEPY